MVRLDQMVIRRPGMTHRNASLNPCSRAHAQIKRFRNASRKRSMKKKDRNLTLISVRRTISLCHSLAEALDSYARARLIPGKYTLEKHRLVLGLKTRVKNVKNPTHIPHNRHECIDRRKPENIPVIGTR